MNKKTIAKAIISLLLVATPLTGMAKKFDEKVIDDPNKVWTIDFNKDIDYSSVNNETVYIVFRDGKCDYEQGKEYNFSNYYQVGSSKVKITYGIEYQEGITYTLVVDGIKSKDGQKLQKTTMDFKADLLTEEELEEREKEEQEKLDKIIDYAFSAMDIERAKSDAAKAEMISTWLSGWLLYDGNALNDGTLTDYQRTALGALETRRTVCEGYARAFKDIAERAGLEVKYILGWAPNNGFHAWNAIKCDGDWYFIDPTASNKLESRKSYEKQGYKLYKELDIEINNEQFDEMSYTDYIERLDLTEWRSWFMEQDSRRDEI